MTATQKERDKDRDYIDKLRAKDDRELKALLITIKKERVKITAEQKRLENKLKNQEKKERFIESILLEKWQNDENLRKAIKEVENGDYIECNTMADYDNAMAQND